MFQRAMECVLQGVDNTVVYFDDNLVTCASWQSAGGGALDY